MKIKIIYLPEEARQAGALLKLLRNRLPGAKLHASSAEPPQKAVYLTTTPGGKRHKIPGSVEKK